MLAGAGTCLSHGSKAVSIVNQQTEIIFLFQFYNPGEISQVTRHAEHTLGDNQNAAIILFCLPGGKPKHLLTSLNIIVREYKTFSSLGFVQKDTIHDAGMCFGIIDDHIVSRNQ